MFDIEKQRAQAIAFRTMHHGPKILLLPNVWDVASARILEEAGFGAMATTSAGIAFTLGYPDGQKISREEMLARVGRIARAVKVPVTADVEAGYGDRAEDAAETARGVIEAGAVGMNLEDGTDRPGQLVELSLQLEKIRAIRETALKSRVLLVLNARTDVYLEQVGAPENRYGETIRRLLAYRDAGADCVFAPGVRDVETISAARTGCAVSAEHPGGTRVSLGARTGKAGSCPRESGLRSDACHAGTGAENGGGTEDDRNLRSPRGCTVACRCEPDAGTSEGLSEAGIGSD